MTWISSTNWKGPITLDSRCNDIVRLEFVVPDETSTDVRIAKLAALQTKNERALTGIIDALNRIATERGRIVEMMRRK